MNAYLEASGAVLEELLDSLAELVRPLDGGTLNWSPLPEGTNSIAALVGHTVGSTASWLARATGEVAPRDRDAEFRARATSEDLTRLIERCQTEVRRRLSLLDGLDPAGKQSVHRIRGDVDAEVTAAWCLEHAIVHAGEHWGQIQLTAQLCRSRPT